MRVTQLEPSSPAPAPSPPRSSAPVELLWFDESFVERIEKSPRFEPILAERQAASLAKAKQDKKLRAKPTPDAAAAPDKRSKIATILSSGEPSGAEELNQALRDAMDDPGTFTPPLLLMGGTLEFPFDELETLKATMAAVSPLAAGDKKLNEILGTISELLRTPWLQASGSGSERLTKEVKGAFATASRMVPTSYLETQTERLLLEQRHYQKRTLLGQRWIRALLVPLRSSSRIPTYLPETLARELPMFQQFPVRLLAEARTQVDQYETSPTALRVVALARLLSGLSRHG